MSNRNDRRSTQSAQRRQKFIEQGRPLPRRPKAVRHGR